MNFYRWFLRFFVLPLIKKTVDRTFDFKKNNLKINNVRKNYSIWFHGASAGELETLTPIIERALQSTEYDILISVFSKSGLGNLKKLYAWANENGFEKRVQVGLSPWEGEWKNALALARPLLFVTSKYEAWPELWVSLVELKIPLNIVAARARRSLSIAKVVCTWVTGKTPDLYLDADEDALLGLKKIFNHDRVSLAPDTRWDRVKDRLSRTGQRGQDLKETLRKSGKNYSVLGSFWTDDFFLFENQKLNEPLTLWCVVPHDVDEKNCGLIEKAFLDRGAKVTRSKGKSVAQLVEEIKTCDVLLINETGVLLDLYAGARWVYIGGGFSKGVHSTIEPAFAGVPLSCGAKRSDEFSEISFLKNAGQLTILNSAHDFNNWVTHVDNVADQKRETWKKLIQTKLGASDKVWSKLNEILKGQECLIKQRSLDLE